MSESSPEAHDGGEQEAAQDAPAPEGVGQVVEVERPADPEPGDAGAEDGVEEVAPEPNPVLDPGHPDHARRGACLNCHLKWDLDPGRACPECGFELVALSPPGD